MRNYGSLTGGDGVSNTFTGSFVPEFIIIGDVGDALIIEGVQVNIGGDPAQNVVLPNANVWDAIAQLTGQRMVGAGDRMAAMIRIADGFVPDEEFEITLTASAAGTPAVLGYSSRKSENRQFTMSGTKTLQANDNQLFENFQYLVFEDDNFDTADIQFADGHNEAGMNLEALKSLLSETENLPSGVDAENVIAISNRFGNIASVRINAGAGGTVTVANVIGI